MAAAAGNIGKIGVFAMVAIFLMDIGGNGSWFA